jgi:hypothetical protein
MATSTPAAAATTAASKIPASSHSLQHHTDTESAVARAALTQLQKEFNTYKKEHENIIQVQMEKTNTQLSDVRSAITHNP